MTRARKAGTRIPTNRPVQEQPVTSHLVLEDKSQPNETPTIGPLQATPPVGGDYWRYRVRLTDTQAIVGFPKFFTVGIGFAVEGSDWNRNLPYTSDALEIYKHIEHNKGDDAISSEDCVAAIRMIQDAVANARLTEEAWPMTSDTLRRAAKKLRAMLDDLGDCRGPWYVVNREQRPYPQRIDNIGVPYVVASTTTDPSHPPTIADYICAMHPGVGRALVDWLEAEARRYDRAESIGEFDDSYSHAFTMAQQLLLPAPCKSCPGCGCNEHTGFCEVCGCLDNRVKPEPTPTAQTGT